MLRPHGQGPKRLVIKDDKLVGACLYGDTVDGSWYFKLLREGKTINEICDHLMFGESNIGDVGHEGHSKAADEGHRMRSVAATASAKVPSICRRSGQGLVHPGRSAQAHQGQRPPVDRVRGLVEQILMFTAGATSDAEDETDVRLH